MRKLITTAVRRRVAYLAATSNPVLDAFVGPERAERLRRLARLDCDGIETAWNRADAVYMHAATRSSFVTQEMTRALEVCDDCDLIAETLCNSEVLTA